MTGQLLEQRLDSILSFIETSVKQTAQFAADQVPDVVNQIIVWNMVKYTITGVSLTLLSILSFFLFKKVREWGKGYKATNEWDDNGSIAFGFGVGGQIVSVLLTITAASVNFGMVLKLWLAPKLFLIEYVSSLLTK